MRIDRRYAAVVAALGLAVGSPVSGSAGSTLAAQEMPARPVLPAPSPDTRSSAYVFYASTERARLGVYLAPGCDVAPHVSGDCLSPPVVSGVVEGAPAAEAGIQPGDTLLTLDGVPLRSQSGRRALATLEPGVVVELEIGRPAGRSEIRVAPTSRPMDGAFRLSGGFDMGSWSRPPDSPRPVYRVRDAEGGTAEFYFRAGDQEYGAGEEQFVVFRADEDGIVQIDVAQADVPLLTSDGRPIELRELEQRVREMDERFRGDVAWSGTLVGEGAEAAAGEIEGSRAEGRSRRLILENAPLARRLENVRNEALVAARARIGSVLERQAELVRRGAAPPELAGYVSVAPSRGGVPTGEGAGPAAPLPRGVAPASPGRLAGAEFWPLTDELAENFDVDRGILVLRVIPETPAHRAGLRSGDVVVEAGGAEVTGVPALRALLADAQRRGAPLDVKWNRKGTVHEGALGSP